ncbi:hypothetical protein TraAM80_10494 [Trypanosoma rangeli]|uniref:Uncharacterized protein n=1 Tax=Trypanosoma rangeli TaxID=5698 RepID=A0A3R7K6M5_TRYRA|nr:uncharacterized protein TraAM80_10494 [Trypanosoma rangeli]RNE94932.1 hypothetical protein TraAM80_10494 [Trypanosoma rangeli]|eukprot:RNE94932.1 hypothetical protein TraAM80_10494 [Trypanosoma rangeli]
MRCGAIIYRGCGSELAEVAVGAAFFLRRGWQLALRRFGARLHRPSRGSVASSSPSWAEVRAETELSRLGCLPFEKWWWWGRNCDLVFLGYSAPETRARKKPKQNKTNDQSNKLKALRLQQASATIFYVAAGCGQISGRGDRTGCKTTEPVADQSEAQAPQTPSKPNFARRAARGPQQNKMCPSAASPTPLPNHGASPHLETLLVKSAGIVVWCSLRGKDGETVRTSRLLPRKPRREFPTPLFPANAN